MLLDHKVVDLFVYPIYAQCQMMAGRMEKIPFMFRLSIKILLVHSMSQGLG